MEPGYLTRFHLSPEEIFADIKSRRTGIIKALTTEFEEFYRQCDPHKKEKLCLFGLPNENWKVHIPFEDSPPDFPEPVAGINFSRGKMEKNDWLAHVATHSDLWLISLALFNANLRYYDKAKRKLLFSLISDLPTLVEIVEDIRKKELKEKWSASSHSGNKSEPNSEMPVPEAGKKLKETLNDEDGAADDHEGHEEDNSCGVCGDSHMDGQFWFCCNKCQQWFHGNCVRISKETADQVVLFKCHMC